jgi:transposase
MDSETIVTAGIDTHTDVHVAAVLDQAGRLLGTKSFPATTRGYAQLATWTESFGQVDKIGMEGTGSFGAGLLRFLTDYGLTAGEVDRPDRSGRRRNGKSDPLDAESAARAVQSGQASGTPKTRDAQVEMIRVLRVARRGAMKARIQAGAQIDALILTAPEQIRSPLRKLTSKQRIRACAALRPGPVADPAAAAKTALCALARRWQALQAEIDDLDAQLTPLVTAAAPRTRHAARHRRGHRRAAPGHRRGQPGPAVLGSLLRPALRSRPCTRLLRPHRPAPAAPRRRPPGQQRPAAHRPGPHGLPPAHQGLRRPPHRRRQDQDRDHALPQALHRPRSVLSAGRHTRRRNTIRLRLVLEESSGPSPQLPKRRTTPDQACPDIGSRARHCSGGTALHRASSQSVALWRAATASSGKSKTSCVNSSTTCIPQAERTIESQLTSISAETSQPALLRLGGHNSAMKVTWGFSAHPYRQQLADGGNRLYSRPEPVQPARP